MTQHRIAAVQAAPKLFDRTETLARFEHWLGEAKKDGADLVVFPESFLGGYPKGVDFGARVGSRDEPGRDLFRLYFENAFDPNGEAFSKVRRLVADAGINVVTGLMEPVGDTLHCAAATLNRQGDVIGWRRKLMPTAMERIIWGAGDGSTLNVAETDIGRVSATICWENYMPLLRMQHYEQGTQIYAAPTVDDRDVWLPSMQMIALEGRCFVISACQHMTRADVADDVSYKAIQGDEPNTVLIRGGSTIISPFGKILAGPVYGQSTLVVADIDMDEITRGKFDLDVAGHYARPDILELKVDRTARLAPPPLKNRAP
ncbi:MAG: carbon-nitrogen hydrolase family protein [Pseudomonadota bacterium]